MDWYKININFIIINASLPTAILDFFSKLPLQMSDKPQYIHCTGVDGQGRGKYLSVAEAFPKQDDLSDECGVGDDHWYGPEHGLQVVW